MKKELVLTLLYFSLISFSQSIFSAELKWNVINRFPLFTKDTSFVNLEQAWPEKGGAEKFLSNESSLTLRKLLPIKDTLWEPKVGTYDKKLFKPNHSIQLNYLGEDSNKLCTWYLNEKIQGQDLCSKGFKVKDIRENEHFNISVQVEALPPLILKDQLIKTELIVGLGDSFSSGEGNPDHPTLFDPMAVIENKWFTRDVSKVIEQPVDWWDRTCHRSLLSWQALYAMQKAVVNPYSVVRFVSFACSGAEIYDGFLRPQKSPPGSSVTHVRKLKMSQHDALTALLCQSGKVTSKAQKWHNKEKGLSGQKYFGQFNLAQCSVPLTKIDELLLSFGGNDVGFSGVVRWGLVVHDPDNHKKDILGLERKLAIKLLSTYVIKPISPDKAAKSLNKMDRLYDDLDKALLPFQVQPKNIFAMIYPDPMPTNDFEGCQARSRDGNMPFSLMMNLTHFSSFKFGLGGDDGPYISQKFITPLRNAQLSAIDKISKKNQSESWTIVDANQGFSIDNNHARTICSTTNSCDFNQCEYSNRLTWVKPNPKDRLQHIPRLIHLNDFSAYDPNRNRGLLYASDALLTQTGETKGKIDDDWRSGVAHPTATVHARIADRLISIAKQ